MWKPCVLFSELRRQCFDNYHQISFSLWLIRAQCSRLCQPQQLHQNIAETPTQALTVAELQDHKLCLIAQVTQDKPVPVIFTWQWGEVKARCYHSLNSISMEQLESGPVRVCSSSLTQTDTFSSTKRQATNPQISELSLNYRLGHSWAMETLGWALGGLQEAHIHIHHFAGWLCHRSVLVIPQLAI